MRALLVAAALLLTAPSALAQMPSPTYVFTQASGPSEAQLPGSAPTFNFTAERSCVNPADVVPETLADVVFNHDGNLTVAGPGQVRFPEQVCARQPRVVVAFQATVSIALHASAGPQKVEAVLHPQAAGPLPRHSNTASVEFLVPVRAAAAAEAAAAEVEPAPGPALLLALAALALAAVAVRRRTA